MISKRPSISPQDLEAALFKAENTVESHRNILELLFNARVYAVLDEPWDGQSLPSTETHILLVSDGDNLNQAMLALFTGLDKANMVPRGDSLFQYPMEVDARWALLGLPKNAGIIINPNTAPGFRILPELSAELRSQAQRYLAGLVPHSTTTPASEPPA